MAEVPDALFADADAEARWRDRFTAARVSLPRWAHDAPDRNLYLSNSSGVWEVYAWDRATGTHRQVTDRPNGTSYAAIGPGRRAHLVVRRLRRRRVRQLGQRAVRRPPGRRGGRRRGARQRARLPGRRRDRPHGQRGRRLQRRRHHGVRARGGGEAETVYRDEHDGGVAALSRDETLLAIEHSEHGDNRHPALRVLSVADGSVVAEKWDGKGKGLDAIGFSPVDGDQRLLVLHERRGREELLIWDVATDTETEIALDLPGEVSADWYPDGSAIVVMHTHEARNTLHRYDVATRHPDHFGHSQRDDRRRGRAAGRHGRVRLVERRAAAGGAGAVRRRHRAGAARAAGPQGAGVGGADGRVRAGAPAPATCTRCTRGPRARRTGRCRRCSRCTAARTRPTRTGSRRTGRCGWTPGSRWCTSTTAARRATARQWRDAIEGRPGLTELADVAAVHAWAVEKGLADPARCVVNGASWGGYLSLLALGTQPSLWAAGIAGVPVADYLSAYADEMEPLRAFDRALFGGSPDEVHERYVECSPITYVDEVRAPVLVVAGENDPRCPIRQIENYLERLAVRKRRLRGVPLRRRPRLPGDGGDDQADRHRGPLRAPHAEPDLTNRTRESRAVDSRVR